MLPAGLHDHTPALPQLADDDLDVVQLVLHSLQPVDAAKDALNSLDKSKSWETVDKLQLLDTTLSPEVLTALQKSFEQFAAQAFAVEQAKICQLTVSQQNGAVHIEFPTTGWSSEEKQRVRQAELRARGAPLQLPTGARALCIPLPAPARPPGRGRRPRART